MMKNAYRVFNWREYNQSLKIRGDLTIWIDEASISQCYKVHPSTRGAPRVYSDAAVKCALTVRSVFGLPLRQTEGVIFSFFCHDASSSVYSLLHNSLSQSQ